MNERPEYGCPDDERLDRHADKLGSYDLARIALGIASGPAQDEPELLSHPDASKPKNRKRPRHLRHGDEPDESDAFWAMTGDYLSRTREEIDAQQDINLRGRALIKAALERHRQEEIGEQMAADVELKLEQKAQHLAISKEDNDSWDAIEAQIKANENGRLF